jgi:hypothetical protein
MIEQIKTVFRGNKPITVQELRDLLAPYDPQKEVTFHVDTNGYDYVSFTHVESVDNDNGAPWIELVER